MHDKKTSIPADKRANYDRLIDSHPDIERKGATMPYTSCNGHMFTYLSKEGKIGIRLPQDQRAAFLSEHNATLFEQHGHVMKEYVTVPDDLARDTNALKPYLQMSYDYVRSLKPKPTKRKQK